MFQIYNVRITEVTDHIFEFAYKIGIGIPFVYLNLVQQSYDMSNLEILTKFIVFKPYDYFQYEYTII